MGYTTDFEGSFTLDRPLTVPQFNYLKKFSETRHMKRNVAHLIDVADPLRLKVGLPLGVEGEFFIADEETAILDGNQEASTQPGLWCSWAPTEDGEGIEWDGSEKFYEYVKWLKYIIKNFIQPWGYTLNGEVEWEGEENTDMGKIVVKDNKVTTKVAKVTYSVDYEDGED
jgi:hypothetical protein